MKIEKFKRQATLRMNTGGTLDVNFFLSYPTDQNPKREHIIDVLNSDRDFIPLEDILSNEILLIGKNRFMDLELSERDIQTETLEAHEIAVEVELVNGEVIHGSVFTELPPNRLRLSDFLNFTPQFIYVCREQSDVLINKDYILSVKQK